jgi:NAD dependent epimerase/dehydratase family enzyme
MLVSGSAVGCRNAGDEPLTEDSASGSDFLAAVRDWERAALAAAAVTRVGWLRTGVVLARDGGALPAGAPVQVLRRRTGRVGPA